MTVPPSVMLGEVEQVQKRPRREIGSALMTLLRPAFRFSYSRDAYVLRLVGNRIGPVLRAHPPIK